MKDRQTIADLKRVAEENGIPCLALRANRNLVSLNDVLQVLEDIAEPTFNDSEKLRSFLKNWGRSTENVTIIPLSEFPPEAESYYPGVLAIAIIHGLDADIIISEGSKVEGPKKTETQNVPLAKGIYEFVRMYGPVDMREIIVGGKRTGWISKGHDEQTIVAAIQRQLDTKELAYDPQQRIMVRTS